jgi:hypothetical protein
MKQYFINLVIIFFLMALSSVPACKSDKSGSSVHQEIDEQEASEIADRIEQVKKVYHLCPSPAEMLSVINVSDMEYDGSILNPTGNVDHYFDSRSQTLNLGVYVTDLAYTALFGRHDETIDYLEIVQQVSEQVRVTGAINEGLISRAKDNVEYLDSLFAISNEAFINMLSFCEKNKRPNTIMLFSAGAFIESIYLAVNMVDSYDASDYLVTHLAEQKYALDNLITSAESLSEDPNVASVLNDMQPLISMYGKIGTSTGGTTIKKEGENKLIIGGGSKISLSEENFNQLKAVVLEIRDNIVSENI